MDEERNGSALRATAKLPSPGQGGLRRTLCQPEVVAALVLSLVALGLHIMFLNHAGGLWRDEVNTVNLAGQSSPGAMVRDSFPVLMPALVHGWTAIGLGAGDLGLRALGILIGLGLLAALWVSALGTSGLPPRLSLALFGLNSTVVIYGDSLRPYGVGSLLIVLAVGTMWAFVKKPTAWRALLAASMAVLSVQALYQNSVLVAAICFGAWAVNWRRRAWRTAGQVALIATAAAASLVPYVPVLATGREGDAILRGGFEWPRAATNLHRVTGFPMEMYAYLWALVALAIVAGGCAALRRKARRSATVSGEVNAEDLRLFAATTLLTGLVGFGAFHWFAGLPAKRWYLLPLLAVAVACFDAGLPPLPRRLRVALFGVLLATAGITIPCAYRPLSGRLTNVDLLARRLAAEASPGDFIVVAPWYCGLTFERYYKGSAAWSTLPPLQDHSLHRYDLLRAQLQNRHAIQPVLERIAATLQAGNTVWVAGHMYIFRAGIPPPDDLPPAPLPASGWLDGPYQRIWLVQLACFLGDHSRQLDRVYSSAAGEVNPNEDLELVQASGWQPSMIQQPTSMPAITKSTGKRD
jgi:hypothetical protein